MTTETVAFPRRRSPIGKRPRHGLKLAMQFLFRRPARWLLAVFAPGLMVGAGIAAWHHPDPASAAPGWRYQVQLEDCNRVLELQRETVRP
jgi:hypothetical protein